MTQRFLLSHAAKAYAPAGAFIPLKTYKMTYQHIAERANIVGYSSYSLRKLGATYIRRNRVSELDIETMLAHSMKGQTGRYAHEEPEYLIGVRKTMQQLLEALDPPWLRPCLAASPAARADETFWSMTYPNEVGCWIWQETRTPEGHGHTGHDLAHRSAYELAHGPIHTGIGCANIVVCMPAAIPPLVLGSNA